MQEIFAIDKIEEREIIPPTVADIAREQLKDRELKKVIIKLNNNEKTHDSELSLQVIDDTTVLVRNRKQMVIPNSLRLDVVMWYHHYLQHPGHT